MTDEYLSVDEAAKEMEVSRATMWKWVKRHELATFRFMGDRKTFLQREDMAKLKEPVRVDFQTKQAAYLGGRLQSA